MPRPSSTTIEARVTRLMGEVRAAQDQLVAHPRSPGQARAPCDDLDAHAVGESRRHLQGRQPGHGQRRPERRRLRRPAQPPPVLPARRRQQRPHSRQRARDPRRRRRAAGSARAAPRHVRRSRQGGDGRPAARRGDPQRAPAPPAGAAAPARRHPGRTVDGPGPHRPHRAPAGGRRAPDRSATTATDEAPEPPVGDAVERRRAGHRRGQRDRHDCRTSTAAGTARSRSGYDCSGSVSYALAAAGPALEPARLHGLHELGRAGRGPAHHRLRQRRPRLHGGRRPALRHERAVRRRHPLDVRDAQLRGFRGPPPAGLASR